MKKPWRRAAAGAALAALSFLPASGATAQAPPDATDRPRYERAVHPGAAGPNRLALDLPLLAGASPFSVVERLADVNGTTAPVAVGGLADLRLHDENGREVPYLVVEPPSRAAEWVTGRILPVMATKTTSGFEVDLGAVRPAAALSLAGLPAPYLKRARLEGSGDRARWTVLQDETTLFDLPDEMLTRREVEFATGEYRYLRLTWDDTNSARLPLPRAARVRLVAFVDTPAAVRVPLVFERRGSEPGVSRYRLSLPGAHLSLTAIELSVAGGYVLRRAVVSESRLSGAEMVPVDLGSAVLRRAVRDDLAAAELRVPIAAPQETRLELVVEDGNNPPLELTGVTAVFAELPWIYFEAPAKRDLVARFGSRSAAPHYDLEAVRPSITRTRLAEAAWGERVDLSPAAVVPAPAAPMPAVGAALDTSAFTNRRPIPAGPRGLTALRLDEEVLAHGRFADLRIVTPDHYQVPYLVERLDEPLALDLPPLQAAGAPPGSSRGDHAGVPSGGTQTTYSLRLPESGLPASRLVLNTPARVFTRLVRVLAERDTPRSPEPRTVEVVAQAAWKHSEPETPAPPLALPLPDGLPATLRVVVDEGDNSPLPLERPRLLLPAYRLRFFRETDEPLSLLYGNPEASAPRYDLALLAPRLVGAPAHEVSPGPEEASQAPRGGAFTATRVFWGALVAAVLILLALLARLLRT